MPTNDEEVQCEVSIFDRECQTEKIEEEKPKKKKRKEKKVEHVPEEQNALSISEFDDDDIIDLNL